MGSPQMKKFRLPPPFHTGITIHGNGETKWFIILIWWFFLNSQMVTNTIGNGLGTGYWIVPVWKQDASIPVSIRWSPYGNGEPELLNPHMETVINHFHMGIYASGKRTSNSVLTLVLVLVVKEPLTITMPQLDVLLQNWWTLRPPGRYGANTRPMAASSGI
jgi:hypothetical protein